MSGGTTVEREKRTKMIVTLYSKGKRPSRTKKMHTGVDTSTRILHLAKASSHPEGKHTLFLTRFIIAQKEQGVSREKRERSEKTTVRHLAQ